MQRPAERTLQAIFEAFNDLSPVYNSEEQLKQLSTELGMMITEAEAVKPAQLSVEETFLLSDMYMRYGHTLTNKAAIDAYQSAYDQIKVRSMPRTFRWHLYAARLRHNQALSVAEGEDDRERYFSQTCQLLCDALTINVLDADEFEELTSLYLETIKILLQQEPLLDAIQNTNQIIKLFPMWIEKNSCALHVAQSAILFGTKLARQYLAVRAVETGKHYLRYMEELATLYLKERSAENDFSRSEIVSLLGLCCELEENNSEACDYYKKSWKWVRRYQKTDLSDKYVRFCVSLLTFYLDARGPFSELREERKLTFTQLDLLMKIKCMEHVDFSALHGCFSRLRNNYLPLQFEYAVYQFGVDFFAGALSATPKVFMILVESLESLHDKKSAARSLLVLIKQMEAYYHYPEIRTSEMGVALNHREYRQRFESIAKQLNEKYSVAPNSSLAESMRNGLTVFSSRTPSASVPGQSFSPK